ncbi:MAG: hypothetical protein ACKO3R_02635 [bacterium]
MGLGFSGFLNIGDISFSTPLGLEVDTKIPTLEIPALPEIEIPDPVIIEDTFTSEEVAKLPTPPPSPRSYNNKPSNNSSHKSGARKTA